MYTLKTIALDFIVREENAQRQASLGPSGKHLYFSLEKEGWNTHSALTILAKELGVPSKAFSIAGLKDKHALTSQLCSIKVLGSAAKLESSLRSFTHPQITISILGYSNSPLSLGDLEGNHFEIVVRHLESTKEATARKYFVNYFDEQRFSRQNARVGKLLLRKDFAKAAVVLAESHPEVAKSLEEIPSDSLRAIKTLSRRILLLYLHSYQSFLFNELVASYLRKKYPAAYTSQEYSLSQFIFCDDSALVQQIETQLPLVGFETEFEDFDPFVQELLEQLLEREDIDLDDFIIKQLEGMSLIGENRKICGLAKDLVLGPVDSDELHSGFCKQTVSFSLSKGSYATMLIRQLYLEN